MKTKFFYALSICLAVLAFVGCKEDPVPAYLEVSESELSLNYEGDEVSLTIESNTSWKVTGVKSWLEVSDKQGSGSATITISADENANLEDRSCEIKITTINDSETVIGMESQTVIIVQEATPSKLSVDTHQIDFKEGSALTKSFAISSNDKWAISGTPDWLDLSKNEGKGSQEITVTTMTSNNSDKVRTAELKISAGSNVETIVVSQAPAWVQNCKANVVGDIFTMCDGMLFNVEITNNLDYFYGLIMYKEEETKYSLNEIIEEAVESGIKYAESGIYTVEGLDEDTEFVIYFVPFKNDAETGNPKMGTPTSFDFKTKSTSFEPRVYISDPTYDASYWYYSFTKRSYCSKYYTFVTDAYEYLYLTDLEMAYILYEAVKDEPPMLESGSWYTTISSTGYIGLYALGISEDGELSGTLDWNYGLILDSTSEKEKLGSRRNNKHNRLSHEEFEMFKEKIRATL